MVADDPTPNFADGYCVPSDAVESEIVIKKSRFISRVAYASDRDQAQHWLARARADYPDARHHCWAYRLGSPQTPRSQAFSDDGEPGGTAGKPILNVLQHQPVGDVMLIVIRYFGGTKLGAGGLVRAYSQAAQTAMEQLSCRVLRPHQAIQLHCDFAQEQFLRHWFASREGSIIAVDYAEAVIMQVSLPVSALTQWQTEAARLGLPYQTVASAGD